MSAIVTIDDIKQFFTGEMDRGSRDTARGTSLKSDPHAVWHMSEVADGDIIIINNYFELDFTPSHVLYHVEIRAHDDPSDSDREVTDDPMSFIVQFMGTGTEGDAFFERMSSDPDAAANVLRMIASAIESGRVSRTHVQRSVFFVAAAIDPEWIDGMRSFVRTALGRSHDPGPDPFDLDDLKSRMEKKGWRPKMGLEGDEPMLIVDIGGVYEARITLDSIMWECGFERANNPSTRMEQTVSDPIAAFQEYRKSKEGR